MDAGIRLSPGSGSRVETQGDRGRRSVSRRVTSHRHTPRPTRGPVKKRAHRTASTVAPGYGQSLLPKTARQLFRRDVLRIYSLLLIPIISTDPGNIFFKRYMCVLLQLVGKRRSCKVGTL